MKRNQWIAGLSNGYSMGVMIAGLILSNAAHADSVNTSRTKVDVSNRETKKFGLYVGVFNDPAPSLFSINAGYNLTDYMRLSAGIGRLSSSLSFGGQTPIEASVTTVGAGAKFMVPGWSLTPTAGIGYSHVFYSGTPGMLEVGGFSGNGGHVYVSGGLDWQAESGFNVGLGVNQSLRADVGSSAYINLGWFFDMT